MVAVGVLGINFKTADLNLREAFALGAQALKGEKGQFFPHPFVLLSTCNRTEIYFSAADLASAHSDLLHFLRTQIDLPFEHRLYSYFGTDCFVHLCRVTAGLDSAILAETEIQRQVKLAYAGASEIPSCLHHIFQKSLHISKQVRNLCPNLPRSLFSALWTLANWKEARILLVGYSEINRGFLFYLQQRGVTQIALSTRCSVKLEGVAVYDRSILSCWQEFDLIVTATHSLEGYLIQGKSTKKTVIFDLSVPRNVDPATQAFIYNIEHIHQIIQQPIASDKIQTCEDFIVQKVLKSTQSCRTKRMCIEAVAAFS